MNSILWKVAVPITINKNIQKNLERLIKPVSYRKTTINHIYTFKSPISYPKHFIQTTCNTKNIRIRRCESACTPIENMPTSDNFRNKTISTFVKIANINYAYAHCVTVGEQCVVDVLSPKTHVLNNTNISVCYVICHNIHERKKSLLLHQPQNINKIIHKIVNKARIQGALEVILLACAEYSRLKKELKIKFITHPLK